MSESHIDIRLNVDGPGAADRIAKALAEAIREQRRYPHVCPPHDLDAAWAAAEAALPRGWHIFRIVTYPELGDEWHAEAGPLSMLAYFQGDGPTPAAALLSLAERLRAVDAPRSGEVGRSDEGIVMRAHVPATVCWCGEQHEVGR